MLLQSLFTVFIVTVMMWECSDGRSLTLQDCASMVVNAKSLLVKGLPVEERINAIEKAGYNLCDLQENNRNIKKMCRASPKLCEDIRPRREIPLDLEKRRTRSRSRTTNTNTATMSTTTTSSIANFIAAFMRDIELVEDIDDCLMIGSGVGADGMTERQCLFMVILNLLMDIN
jgi:hypothetical protein